MCCLPTCVELKGKKSQLEEQIRKAKDKKERMTGPQEKLRAELKQKRHEVLFQLKHQGEETQAIESEIYSSGCKLRTVYDENKRFEEGIKALNAEIEDISYQMEHNAKLKLSLLIELEHTKSQLEKTWDDDQETQKRFGARDQEVVEGLGALLERTVRREETISHVTSQLEVELQYLTAFLDNLASRRPKDSYMSNCRTPTPDSRDGRRPGSRDSRLSGLSRASSRSQALADLGDNSPSRPPTSKSNRSGRSVVIAEEITEIDHETRTLTKSPTKRV
ncbi:hypothetical protein DPMN_098888 [Dreissena polymorpha]|uniref:Uncharacterized protein n=1 Tax=Dreissena polymorpha TaxID=45954 RepID=A0A9D4LFJ0_DREPO|nr:hypothetical protein DPMN_098888 [Dreissena polymorpha]